MLQRTLEPEVMETADDARQYDTMDHSDVNRQFVDDLLAVRPVMGDVLDAGTGTALIPVELCQRVDSCRIMAADMSYEMLELARYNVEMNGLVGRIQLDLADAKEMPYRDGMFDVVMSNSIVHHIADPLPVLEESLRVTAEGGVLFFRDLRRPPVQEQVEQLVRTYAGSANEYQQQLFRGSLHASLNLEEIRALVGRLGFDADTVQATSDRHWTWVASKPKATKPR